MAQGLFKMALLLVVSMSLAPEVSGQTAKVFSFAGPAGETVIGTGSVTKAMMLPDGNILTGGSIGYLLWDGQTGAFRQWIGGKPYHSISVLDFDLNPQGDSILSAGVNGDVNLIRIDTGEEKAVVDRGKDFYPFVLRFSPDGSKILIAYDDQIQVRDSQTTELLKSYDLSAEGQYVMKAEFVPGSSDVAILLPEHGNSVTIRFWNWETDTMHNWEVETGSNVSSVQLLEDGEGLLIYSLTQAGSSVALWNLVTQAQELIQYDLITLTDANDRSPDGRFLALADPRRILIVDIQQPKEIALLDVSNTSWFSFSPDGSDLLVTRTDSVEVWDVQTRNKTLTIPIQPTWLDAAISPDGNKLLAVSGSKLLLVDTNTLSVLAEAETNLVGNFAFTSDGRFVVQYTDNEIRVLNGDTLQTVQNRKSTPSTSFPSLSALSPDGMTYAYVQNRTIRIEDLNGNLLSAFPMLGSPSLYIDISLTNQQLVLLTRNEEGLAWKDNNVDYWDFRNQILLEIPGIGGYYSSSFSPTNPSQYGPIYTIRRKGVLFFSKGNLQYLEISSDVTESILKKLQSPLSSLWASENNRWMISGEQNGHVGLWDLSTGENVSLWSGHSTTVDRVLLSSNGKTLLSVSMDNTIHLYPVAETTTVEEWMTF